MGTPKCFFGTPERVRNAYQKEGHQVLVVSLIENSPEKK
jgi:hypothetical protein